MSEQGSGRNFIKQMLRRDQGYLDISGYHLGDIQSEHPVVVAPTAFVVGDIWSPKIALGGVLCGHVVSRELTVQRGGQLWGDAFAASILVEPGGKLHGWVSTLSEDSYQLLYSGETSPIEVALADHLEIPLGLVSDWLRAALERELTNPSTQRINALRLLQAEVVKALAQRAEIEKTLDERIAATVRRLSGEAHTLYEEILMLRRELTAAEHDRDTLKTAYQLHRDHVEAQASELVAVRDLLNERAIALKQLKAAHDELVVEVVELRHLLGDGAI